MKRSDWLIIKLVPQNLCRKLVAKKLKNPLPPTRSRSWLLESVVVELIIKKREKGEEKGKRKGKKRRKEERKRKEGRKRKREKRDRRNILIIM